METHPVGYCAILRDVGVGDKFLWGAVIMRLMLRLVVLIGLICSSISDAIAQWQMGPPPPVGMSDPTSAAPFDTSGMGLLELNSRRLARDVTFASSPLQNPAFAVSQLDLRAPKDARRLFDKGFQLYSGKNFQGAIEHFVQALTIYPEYVAAHNALGSAYLALSRNDEARVEFAKAATLDPHMPAPFLNLAYTELKLKHYPSAEIAAQKAASIAPLDLVALTALAYSQLMNRDYAASVETADKIHQGNEDGHSVVHLYAAAALENQQNFAKAGAELQELVKEDPKSLAAAKARELLQQIKTQATSSSSTSTSSSTGAASPVQSQFQQQIALQNSQDAKELEQIADAEAMCEGCESDVPHLPGSKETLPKNKEQGWILHSNVNEVAVWFVATDHGRPIRDLTQSEVTVRDAGKPPQAVVGFRSEDQLPLRLGLVVDTSESVAGRFKFEQTAAEDFLQKVLTDEHDSAFVVGVSNSVLLVQDFTSEKSKLSDAIGSLAPVGGTALWDAVSFAADKLSALAETQPVARVLVVISDGRDNSSRITLKQAIEASEHKDVTIYTVSTSDVRYISTAFLDSVILGNHALKTLAERTGGMALTPGSIGNLNHSLDDLQEFIRSRYALSYKPTLLKHDDQYRSISISAQKSGRKLKVYARKGYYARATFTPSDKAVN